MKISAPILDKTEPRVTIIILNWNGWEDTIECIESLLQIEYRNFDILVVDNGSANDSIEKIVSYANGDINVYSHFVKNSHSHAMNTTVIRHNEGGEVEPLNDSAGKERITIIALNGNQGYTEGNNIGFEYSMRMFNPKYVLILNNDTVVDPGFLQNLTKRAEADEQIGFLSPKILFYEYGGRTDIIQYAGSRQSLFCFNPKHIGLFDVDDSKYKDSIIDYPHGSCFLARTRAVKEIGLFDKDYFCYREENDLGFRARKAGWKSIFVSDSKIWHKGGKSGGFLNPKTIFQMTKNDFLIIKKNGSGKHLFVFILYNMIFKMWFSAFLYLVIKKDVIAFKAYICGLIAGLKWKNE